MNEEEVGVARKMMDHEDGCDGAREEYGVK